MRRPAIFTLFVLAALPLAAETGEVTPFVAWQQGGAITIDDRSADLEGGPAFGLFVSLDRGAGRKLDLVLSHQATEASAASTLFGSRTVDVSVTYLHVGGRYFIRTDERVSPYIAATIGGSYFSVDGGDALRPSAAAGGGVDVELSPRTALRLDGRFWFTGVDPDTEIACRGGGSVSCVSFTDTSVMSQFALSAGLVLRW